MSKTARKHASAAPVASRTPHQVRIIGGQWKRTPLPVLDAEGLRPTPDRVRETVFNWLTHLLDGNWQDQVCLDLFAGTGALGFEAASRGAERVVMVENFGPAVRQLETCKDKLQAAQVEVLRGDAVKMLPGWTAPAAAGRGFTLIFLDPPYHQNWLGKIVPLCEQVLAPAGLMYVESEHALEGTEAPDWMANWEIVRSDRAGVVFYHLLQRKSMA